MTDVTEYLEAMTSALTSPVVIQFADVKSAKNYQRVCYKKRSDAKKTSMKGKNPMEDGYRSTPWDRLLITVRTEGFEPGARLRIEKRTKEALGIVEEG